MPLCTHWFLTSSMYWSASILLLVGVVWTEREKVYSLLSDMVALTILSTDEGWTCSTASYFWTGSVHTYVRRVTNYCRRFISLNQSTPTLTEPVGGMAPTPNLSLENRLWEQQSEVTIVALPPTTTGIWLRVGRYTTNLPIITGHQDRLLSLPCNIKWDQ